MTIVKSYYYKRMQIAFYMMFILFFTQVKADSKINKDDNFFFSNSNCLWSGKIISDFGTLSIPSKNWKPAQDRSYDPEQQNSECYNTRSQRLSYFSCLLVFGQISFSSISFRSPPLG